MTVYRQAIGWICMSRKPTQVDVAKLAGVSRTTVSYVINNREAENAIPPDTTARVWTAVKELGYVPNQVAQHLKKQATNRICVVLPRLGIPMNDLMLRAYRKFAAANNYTVIVTIGDTYDAIVDLITQIQGGLADAVHIELGYGSNNKIDEILEQIKGIGVPIVVAANVEPTQDYDSYWTTEQEATYKAIQYLIAQGHEKIAFLGHNIADIEQYGRYKAYIQAMTDSQLPIQEQYIRSGVLTRQQAHYMANELLELDDTPTAIFCTADINALTVIATAQSRGFSVPTDLAVIGCGNISEGLYSYPTLTTIGPVISTFDEIAMLMLKRLTDEEQLPKQKVVQKWELVIRDSA